MIKALSCLKRYTSIIFYHKIKLFSTPSFRETFIAHKKDCRRFSRFIEQLFPAAAYIFLITVLPRR